MNDFGEMSKTGEVLSNQEMRSRRKKRGECEKCGRKCFKRNLFNKIPITSTSNMVLNGRCLTCRPLGTEAGDFDPDIGGDNDGDGSSNNGLDQILEAEVRKPSLTSNASMSSRSVKGRNGNQSMNNLYRSSASAGGNSRPKAPSQTIPRSWEKDNPNFHRNQMVRALSEPGNSFASQKHSKSNYSDIIIDFDRSEHSNDRSSAASVSSSGSNSSIKNKERNRSIVQKRGKNIIEGEEYDESELKVPDFSSRIQSRNMSSRSMKQSPTTTKPAIASQAIGAAAALHLQKGFRSRKNAKANSNEEKAPEGKPISNSSAAVEAALRTKQLAHSLESSPCSLPPKDSRVKEAIRSGFETEEKIRLDQRINEKLHNTSKFTDKKNENSKIKSTLPARTQDNDMKRSAKKSVDVDEMLKQLDTAPEDLSYTDIIECALLNASNTLMQQKTIQYLSQSVDDFSEQDYDDILSLGAVSKILVRMMITTKSNASRHNAEEEKICTEEEKLQTDACWFLWNMSKSASVSQKHRLIAMGKDGCIEAIIHVMDNCRQKEEVQEMSIKALSALGQVDENQLRILKSGGIRNIIQAMSTHSESMVVQQVSCLTFCHIAAHNPAMKAAIAKGGGCDQIIVALVVFSHSVDFLENALSAICAICKSHPENKLTAIQSGAIDSIVSTMQLYRDLVNIQVSAVRTILNLGSTLMTAQLIGESGGIDVIVRAMWVHSDSLDIKKCSCEALHALSMNSSNQTILVDIGGITAIVNAMQCSSDDTCIQEHGCATIALVAQLGDHVKAQIVAEEAIDAITIAMVLHGDNVKVQEQACKSLVNIACEPNFYPLQAANVGELMQAAASKFPAECCESFKEISSILSKYHQSIPNNSSS